MSLRPLRGRREKQRPGLLLGLLFQFQLQSFYMYVSILCKVLFKKNVKTIIPYHAVINKFLPYAFRNPTSVNISRPSQEGALDSLTQLRGSLHLSFWALGPPPSQHLHRRVSLTKNNPIIHNTWGILFGLTVHWNLSGEGSDFFSKYLMAIFDHHLNKLRKLYKKGQKWSATFYMHIYTSHFIYESGFSLKSAKESQENFTSALKYTKQFPLKTMVLSRVIWV